VPLVVAPEKQALMLGTTNLLSPEPKGSTLSALGPPLALCALWALAAVLIDPIGDFPLNDDWAYGLPAEVLVRDGTIRFTYWQSMTLITQVVWGALFCLPNGFSFTALRTSTLTMGLAGVLGFYLLLRRFRAGRPVALAGAALLATNPIYLGLSNTFMTDIPFLALFLWSVLLVIRGLDRDRGGDAWFAAGLGLALLATFIRQLGLAVFLGFLLAYPLRRGLDRGWLLRAVLPTILAGGLLKLYIWVLTVTGRLPRMYYLKPNSLNDFLRELFHLRLGVMKVPLEGILLIVMYCGLFAFPFLVLLGPKRLRNDARGGGWIRPILVVVVAAGVTAVLAAVHRLMPMTGNILIDLGLGVRSMAGPGLPGASWSFWLVVTFVAALGAVLLIEALVATCGATRARPFDPDGPMPIWHLVFLVMVTLLSITPFFLMFQLILDRYFLLPTALFLTLALGSVPAPGPRPSPIRWAVALAVGGLMGAFGLAATHDYLEWNRARWAASTTLVDRQGISPAQIDGGFEFNNLWPNRQLMEQGGADDLVGKLDVPYKIALRPMPDHEIVRRVPCRAWLPYAVREILVLHRNDAP
jgi:hypothetical protein